MRQVLTQRGRIVIGDLPVPQIEPGSLLVAVGASLISTGTEIAAIGGNQSTTERLEQVLAKAKKALGHLTAFGARRTYLKIREKLAESAPLGYSCAGRVLGVGAGVEGFRVGDCVACAGAGQACHAEIVSVPGNLTVPVPGELDLRQACSVALGAIAMQGVRRADPRLGEVVAVIGLGLVGQLTVQLLKAAGCYVIGIDLSEKRAEKARELGADIALTSGAADPVTVVRERTSGHGVDATIIAAATRSSSPIQLAMEMTRKKGRVVAVGWVGLRIEPSPFYEKEIDFLISCSYGPGRYDPRYEKKGLDYPYGFVRWTEKRNMDLYLNLLAEGKVDFAALTEAEYPIDKAEDAYRALSHEGDRPLSVVLTYPDVHAFESTRRPQKKVALTPSPKQPEAPLGVALIGAGEFTRAMHLPNLRSRRDLFAIRWCVTQYGPEAEQISRMYEIPHIATSVDEPLADAEVDMACIFTRHDTHARHSAAAAEAGKAVFCEKPMALNKPEIESLRETAERTGVPFVVNFNRRMAPAAQRLHQIVANRSAPMVMHYRVNAGYIPTDHWTQTEEGGGRLIGEACHMIDLFLFLTGSKIVEAGIDAARFDPKSSGLSTDNFAATFQFENGDVANLVYVARGHPEMEKERIEVFWDNQSAVIDDFRLLRHWGPRGLRDLWKSKTQDKGHRQMLEAFARCILDRTPPPISLEDIVAVSDIACKLDHTLRHGAMSQPIPS